MQATNPELLKRAKAMRSQMTQPERELWVALRAKRFDGIVDGDTHAEQKAYDLRRTGWLEAQGYRVICFSNADVLGNLEGVLQIVAGALAAPLSPLPNPLPHAGEGFARPPSP